MIRKYWMLILMLAVIIFTTCFIFIFKDSCKDNGNGSSSSSSSSSRLSVDDGESAESAFGNAGEWGSANIPTP